MVSTRPPHAFSKSVFRNPQELGKVSTSMSDWPDHPEDFGLTLGRWGVPHGPYLMLPIFGASTVRDTVGLGGDAAMAPYTYFVPFYVPIAARATDLLNKRAIFLEEIEQSRNEAFDFYVFVRNAYLQNRAYRLAGATGEPSGTAGAASPEDEEDLYYFDDFDEEDDEADENADDSDGTNDPDGTDEER